jgi:hypothetical protein
VAILALFASDPANPAARRAVAIETISYRGDRAIATKWMYTMLPLVADRSIARVREATVAPAAAWRR